MFCSLELGDVWRESAGQYQLRYTTGQRDSALLRRKLRPAAWLCAKYQNSTACQQLGNLCALTLHSRQHTACTALVNIERQSNVASRKVPRLFFPSGQTSSTLESETISTQVDHCSVFGFYCK